MSSEKLSYSSVSPESNPLHDYRLPDSYLPIPIALPKQSLTERLRTLGFAALVSFLPATEAQGQEKTTSHEDRVVAVEVMGEALVAQVESLGFTIDVQLEAPVGEPYIIHLGQVHTHPGDMVGRMMTDTIVQDFQQKLSELAVPLATVGTGVIFDEGISRNSEEMEEDRLAIVKFKESIEQISSSTLDTSGDVQKALRLIGVYQKFVGHRLVANTINPEVVNVLIERVTNAITELPAETEEDKAEKELLTLELTVLNMGTLLSVANRADVSEQDGFASAFLSGSLQLGATEDGELNAKALAAMKEMSAIQRPYNDSLYAVIQDIKKMPLWSDLERYNALAKERSLTTEELADQRGLQNQVQTIVQQHEAELEQTPLGQAYKEAERTYDQLAKAEREAMVFKKIAEYESLDGVELGHIVIRFGNNHDFTNALRQFNATHEGHDRGLIKLHASF
jgi:hypothetical protein